MVLYSEPTAAISEYTFKMPVGMHRCTTTSSFWFLNPKKSLQSEFHGRIAKITDCKGCKRDYHVYKLEAVNALFVVADPDCEGCPAKQFGARPEEGETRPVSRFEIKIFTRASKNVLQFPVNLVEEALEDCQLPERYRKRPSECFARDEKVV